MYKVWFAREIIKIPIFFSIFLCVNYVHCTLVQQRAKGQIRINSALGFIASIKNIKQNILKNIIVLVLRNQH